MVVPEIIKEKKNKEDKTISGDNDNDLLYLTDVTIITTVDSYSRTGYQSRDTRTVELDDPLSHRISTRGLVISVAPVVKRSKLAYDREAWHGLAHLIIAFAGLVLGTRGIQDIECEVTRGYLLLHENTSGGRGIAMAIMRDLTGILVKGLANLTSCSCLGEGGCPRCLYLYGCRERNDGLDKRGAMLLAETLLELLVK